MIKSYYAENGQYKVDMDLDTAGDIRVAIDAFRAGMELTSFSEKAKEWLTGNYIADTFLQGQCLNIPAKENYEECEPRLVKFLHDVEEKIDELL